MASAASPNILFLIDLIGKMFRKSLGLSRLSVISSCDNRRPSSPLNSGIISRYSFWKLPQVVDSDILNNYLIYNIKIISFPDESALVGLNLTRLLAWRSLLSPRRSSWWTFLCNSSRLLVFWIGCLRAVPEVRTGVEVWKYTVVSVVKRIYFLKTHLIELQRSGTRLHGKGSSLRGEVGLSLYRVRSAGVCFPGKSLWVGWFLP